MPPQPIDPATGERFVLRGRVVTMDRARTVIPRGNVCVAASVIQHVLPVSAPLPDDFADAPVVDVGGTMYPGMIDLHNHLPYNVLPMWVPDRSYKNRNGWSKGETYRREISGPMKVLGMAPGLPEAVARYVEVKLLMGGVTTSQGLKLYSNAGVHRYYKGTVRNVEQTDEATLPEAATRVADVDARSWDSFNRAIGSAPRRLLHLAEGVDDTARNAFLALKNEQTAQWAITPNLIGIHCTALELADFARLHSGGAAMVWSPFSNLALYGKTTRVDKAKTSQVPIALGSDWSPSGTKNLLGELKIAWRVNKHLGQSFTDDELVAMASSAASDVIGWEHVLGSLEEEKKADIVVLSGNSQNPYRALITSDEADIRLVVINGTPRYGTPGLMRRFSAHSLESVRVRGSERLLHLKHAASEPGVEGLTLSQAKRRLEESMDELPGLAAELETQPGPSLLSSEPQWFLELDHTEPTEYELRPRLEFGGRLTGPEIESSLAAAAPLSEVLQPMKLDGLTSVDDPDYRDAIEANPNLPDWAKHD